MRRQLTQIRPALVGVPRQSTHCCRDAVAEIGGRHLSDVASSPRRKTDQRTLGCQLERAREPCHRRAGHLRIDHPASSSTRRWDLPKRQAVLAHEGAHVANRDFHVLLLASLNRAVFWFSPFAWWQHVRLAELAEIISDARALEVFEDRLSYQRFCSTSCRCSAAPAAWKWRERVPSARALSAFLPQPQRRQRQGGGNGSGRQRPSCRLSSCLPAPSLH